ncbi:HAMP domain-containing histidine kinase [Ciceribacter sp. L1K23]|uniref:sensor histidine kinase n=1 Tax=Ciceribacter sp. L1K23 TaxID=2820276 RepID=UPI001B811BB2|nr:HAMP domain-containing sensor histidine kinase [Ciceribacter sp. L1K23]MBR0555830.1 HAMP domain-containing histidine kinase [Ciceribacter sp. L1K23]
MRTGHTRKSGIALRLIGWLSALLIVFWLAAAGLGLIVMRGEFDEIFDSGLQQAAARLAPVVAANLSGIKISPPAPLPDEADDYLVYQVRDHAGAVLMQSHAEHSATFDIPLAAGFFEDRDYRYYTIAIGDTFVQVADSLAHRREATLESAATLLLPIVLLLPLGILVVFGVVRRSMVPVEILRAEISAKDGGNLDPVGVSDLPSELQPIGASVNLMLSRLRAALDAEREFTANSAHELRTPLAGALAQTQLLLRELQATPQEARVVHIQQSLTRLAKLTEKLLQLSRAEAGIGAADRVTDLVPALDMVVGDFERTARWRGLVRYQRSAGAELMRAVDPDAFAIVMRNLIENALIHGERAGEVGVVLERNAIRITNGGPVVPRDTLVTVRRRFARGNTGGQGTGLGLAIVDRLLEHMGGKLTLSSPAPGRADGVEARVTL